MFLLPLVGFYRELITGHVLFFQGAKAKGRVARLFPQLCTNFFRVTCFFFFREIKGKTGASEAAPSLPSLPSLCLSLPLSLSQFSGR